MTRGNAAFRKLRKSDAEKSRMLTETKNRAEMQCVERDRKAIERKTKIRAKMRSSERKIRRRRRESVRKRIK